MLFPVDLNIQIIVISNDNSKYNLGDVKWKSLSRVQLFVTPWTIQSMDFSRPEYWCGYPFPSPWTSPGQNIGVGTLSLLQGIFSTQGLNPCLEHYRWILYQLSHKGSPRILEWIAYPFSRGSSCPGIEPESPASQVYSLPTELSGKNISNKYNFLYHTCFTSFVAISDFVVNGQMLAILTINMTINHKVWDYHKACKTCMV